MPHNILHSVLKNGTRPVGRPRLRFKDVLKRDLRDFNIDPDNWTQMAKDRILWRACLYGGLEHDHCNNIDKLRKRRIRLQTKK